jgi:hypothetical protein
MPIEFVAFCVNNCKMQICFVYFELDVCLHEYHISPMRLFYIDTNGTNACLPSCGDQAQYSTAQSSALVLFRLFTRISVLWINIMVWIPAAEGSGD